jgi:hypothetical protein
LIEEWHVSSLASLVLCGKLYLLESAELEEFRKMRLQQLQQDAQEKQKRRDNSSGSVVPVSDTSLLVGTWAGNLCFVEVDSSQLL